MKKTQIKDNLRNIQKQKVSFISIIVIALLGVSVLLALDYSAAGLTRNGSEFFNAQQGRDIELVSTLLFTQQDLEDIRNTEDVADAEAVWQVGAQASSGADREDVNVISLTGRMNLPVLREGRLPETPTECAVEQVLADKMGLCVGNELILQNAAGETVQYLLGNRYTIVGIADHPDHGYTILDDTWYVLVTSAAFDHEELDGCFMKAEIAIAKGADADRFSDAYKASVSAVQARLEDLALTAALRRDAGVHDRFQAQIDEKQRELDDAKAALEAARKELDDGWIALSEGEQALTEARAQLEEAQTQLDDGWKQLEWTIYQLTQGKKELDAAKTELDAAASELGEAKARLGEANAELEDGWGELEDAKAQIRGGIRGAVEQALGDAASQISWAGRRSANVDSASTSAMPFWITTGYCCDLSQSLSANINAFVYSGQITDEILLEAYVAATGSEEGFDADAARSSLASSAAAAAGAYEGQYNDLQSACQTWDDGHAQYIPGLNEYQDGLAKYNESLATYEAGLSRYETGMAAYQHGLAQYNEAKAQVEQGLLDAEAGQKELEEKRKQLEEGEVAYQEALPQIASGEQRLEQAREQLDNLAPCRWMVFDGNSNAAYANIAGTDKNLHDLMVTFGLMFILVGALVIFATVSKMVDEQRTQVGTTKALGFFNKEIFAKYLSFGVSATVLGALLGILFARFVLERVVLEGYGVYFCFDLSRPALTAVPTLLVLLAAAGLAFAAVWAACSVLLRTPAIRLMQARVPAGAKKAGSGKKKALSLYSRLILLNMRTDFRRVLVTIVSVAGCCALVVTGVTLKSAMLKTLDEQYGRIVHYDERIQFSPEESETAGEEIAELLREAGAEMLPLSYSGVTFRFNGTQLAELLCVDADALQDYYTLEDWKTGEKLSGSDEGVLIQRLMAEKLGLDVGSELEIALSGKQPATVKVAGIMEHYVGNPIVMSRIYYQAVFGKSAEINAYLVRLKGAEETALSEALRGVKGFINSTSSDSGKAIFETSTSVVNTVLISFIFMSAVMAGVVLMNLTSIYVLQKKRELTIMRINGFTFKEVVGYMLRETVLTTLLGILFGLAIGSAVGREICGMLENISIQMYRPPRMTAWLAGAGLTVLFTVIVNLIALRPVKDLKLTDVA